MMQTNGPTLGRLTGTLICGVLLVAAIPAAQSEGPHRAFVANAKANAVTVVDTQADTTVGSIEVGLPAKEVAISADGGRAYLAHAGSNAISVIDTEAQAVIATIALGEEPASVRLSPHGDRLYALGNAGLFEVVDTAAATDPTADPVLVSLPVGGSNGRLAVTPDGASVFIVSGGLAVFDTATNALDLSSTPELPSIPGVTIIPVGVTIAPNGARAYITYVTYLFDIFGFRSDGGIFVVDTRTNAIINDIPLRSQPGAVAFSADGHRAFVTIQSFWANTVYAAAFLPGRWVVAVDVDTSSVIEWILLGSTPRGLAVTPDRSSLLVAIPASNAVAVIDPETNTIRQSIAVEGAPSDVAVVPDAAAIPKPFIVDAVDDTAPMPLPALEAGVAAANVLANDTIGGSRAAFGNITLAALESSNPGVALDGATGAVVVAASTPAGSHSLSYRICEAANEKNCDDATVTLTVRERYALNAANDDAIASAGSTAVSSVLANDTLNGAAVSFGSVSLSLRSSDGSLQLNTADGSVTVAAAAGAGEHSLVYGLCEIASPSNCAEGSVNVTVLAPSVHAANDNASSPRTGGIAIANVLANDSIDGGSATLARLTLAAVASTDDGLTLNTATGALSVARGTGVGAQTLDYRICEIARPANCSDASATVTVAPYAITAGADSARSSSKVGGMAIVNVLSNDTFAGAPARTSSVKLSQVSLSPSNKAIRLNADGTVDVLGKSNGGTYVLTYRICEIASPANCAQATLKIDLSGRD